jgi:hypothetical protein
MILKTRNKTNKKKKAMKRKKNQRNKQKDEKGFRNKRSLKLKAETAWLCKFIKVSGNYV